MSLEPSERRKKTATLAECNEKYFRDIRDTFPELVPRVPGGFHGFHEQICFVQAFLMLFLTCSFASGKSCDTFEERRIDSSLLTCYRLLLILYILLASSHRSHIRSVCHTPCLRAYHTLVQQPRRPPKRPQNGQRHHLAHGRQQRDDQHQQQRRGKQSPTPVHHRDRASGHWIVNPPDPFSRKTRIAASAGLRDRSCASPRRW
jgi:hypothetical protein